MDIVTGFVLLLLAASMVGWASGQRQIRALKHELAALRSAELVIDEPAVATGIDTTLLSGAGSALANPPASIDSALGYIRQHYQPGRYTVPLGWALIGDQPACVGASFVGDTNHVLITGRSDSGKDNAAMGMLLSLALTYSPSEVQIAIIDGKGGLDWATWQNKGHVAHLAMDAKDIAPVMESLKVERERRIIKLRGKVTKWDEYEGNDLPLLIVYVAELALLQSALGKSALGDWLTTELVSSRAVGIRYIIASQDVSNLDTSWRRQISLFMAGVQNSQSADMPNTGMYTKDLEALGAIPPSQLPGGKYGAGVFTCIHDRDTATVRTALLTKDTRRNLLARLPEKPLQIEINTPINEPTDSADNLLSNLLQTPQAVSTREEPVEASYRATERENRTPVEQSIVLQVNQESSVTSISEQFYVELPLSGDVVPYEEQRRIIEAAPTVKSKRQLSLKLYQTDGGQKSTWVRLVCDAAGLFKPDGVAA
jgi:hypothetical protein